MLAVGAAGCASAHWSYSGETGPERWASLDEKNAVCESGQRQSPIDISGPFRNAASDLALRYQPSRAVVLNNGHTIQVNITGENTLQSGGKTYRLLQFHFHAPSEEAVSGRRFPLVAHFVHASAAGELAVIGVLFESGAASAQMAPVFANLPSEPGKSVELADTLDLRSLLPTSLVHWNFDGSLTTPPCSEGVNWFVLQNRGRLSPDQISAYTRLYPDTARPLQPRHGREIRSRR
jgi:carbonic anhydrase